MKFEHCLAAAMPARARGSNAVTGAMFVLRDDELK